LLREAKQAEAGSFKEAVRMKKVIAGLMVMVLLVLSFAVNVFAVDLSWEDVGRGNADFRAILIDLNNPHLIYAGTANSIIKSEDDTQSWRVVLNIKGQNKNVNSLVFDQEDKKSIYAATGNGLFCSFDKGNNWKRIFRGENDSEKECTDLAVLPGTIYLGTKGGFFISRDKGCSWHKEESVFGRSQIFSIAYSLKDPFCAYVACLNAVFRTINSGESWERVFGVVSVESDGDEEADSVNAQEECSRIRHISVDPNNPDNIYLSTVNGVFKSSDKGQSWEPVSGYGLLSDEVNFTLVSKLCGIYAATKSGIFEYRDQRWQELSLRLICGKINFLGLDSQNNIYAACDNGLFRSGLDYSGLLRQDSMARAYYQFEPGIDEVQMAAISYAEVEPQKIKSWREKAGKKALLPQVSVGLERNASDLWHWESGSTTRADDDILRRGRDYLEWDVSLSWDLSQLIWNNDQTSIDARSRLMVELRDSILSEVTKLYFERLRVKMEIDNLSIEEKKRRAEKELKLQELTACLNALTGNYFSRQVKAN
jgi:photosystem II stability/assembly factor-like uncharacterized protein